jgi:TRAP-type C4-dicarboxylate transport system permease small subunit
MSGLLSLESRIERWTRIIALIGLVAMLILAFVTVVEALMRYIFNLPIVYISDISIIAITVSIAACFPMVFAQRGNITVRIVGTALGPRISNILEAFGSLVSLCIFLLLTWQLWIYTNNCASAGETTVIAQIPLAPFFRLVTVLFAICIPIQVIVFFDQLRSAITSRAIPNLETKEKNRGH